MTARASHLDLEAISPIQAVLLPHPVQGVLEMAMNLSLLPLEGKRTGRIWRVVGCNNWWPRQALPWPECRPSPDGSVIKQDLTYPFRRWTHQLGTLVSLLLEDLMYQFRLECQMRNLLQPTPQLR